MPLTVIFIIHNALDPTGGGWTLAVQGFRTVASRNGQRFDGEIFKFTPKPKNLNASALPRRAPPGNSGCFDPLQWKAIFCQMNKSALANSSGRSFIQLVTSAGENQSP